MPQDNVAQPFEYPIRKHQDKHINSFGHKLLSLCKENNIIIANGRIEQGNYTFNSLHRNKPIASTVDYLVTNSSNFHSISDMCVLDMTEFSDHCPVTFSFVHSVDYTLDKNYAQYDKIVWDSSQSNSFLNILDNNKHLFDDISQKLTSGENDIDLCLNSMSDVIYDISFKSFCKSLSNKPKRTKPKSPWFNTGCRNAKNDFMKNKRCFSINPSVENKTNFLLSRSKYAKAKRHAKTMFYSKEKNKLSDMSKKLST